MSEEAAEAVVARVAAEAGGVEGALGGAAMADLRVVDVVVVGAASVLAGARNVVVGESMPQGSWQRQLVLSRDCQF